jgi:hypothetical protein
MIFSETWMVFLLSIGVAMGFWFVQNVIHELSHALVALSRGYKVIEFKPYLHRDKTSGKWKFASVRVQRPMGTPPMEKHHKFAWFSMPVWTNLALMMILVPIGIAGDGVGRAICAGIAMTNFFDMLNNMRIIYGVYEKGHTSDLWKAIYLARTPQAAHGKWLVGGTFALLTFAVLLFGPIFP